MKTEAEIRAEIERLLLPISSTTTSTTTSNGGLHQLFYIVTRTAALEWVLADSKHQETPDGRR